MPALWGCILGKKMLPIAGVILNLALNVSLAKGWADKVPNTVVVGLYILSLLPIAIWVVTHEKLRVWLQGRFRDHTLTSVGISVILAFVVVSTVFVVGPRVWKLLPSATSPVATSAPAAKDGSTLASGGAVTSAAHKETITKHQPGAKERSSGIAPRANLETLASVLASSPAPPTHTKWKTTGGISVHDNVLADGNIYENLPNRLEVKDPGTSFTNNTVLNMDATVENGARADNNLLQGRALPNTGQAEFPVESNGKGADMRAIRAAQNRTQYPGRYPDVPTVPAPATASPWPTALHGSNSTLATQLAQLIDQGRKLGDDFLKDDNAQQLGEKEKAWEGEVRAVLTGNLGEQFVDQFNGAASASTTYPQGHGAQGGSICNLIDSKMAVLSFLVNQLRAADR